MTFKTKDGVIFNALPGVAYCQYFHQHLYKIEKCLLRKFDENGVICVPECCENYGELRVNVDEN